jgi:hypothetical protein
VHLEVDPFFSAPLARTPLAQLSGEDHRYGHLSVQQVSRTSFDPWIQPGFVELNKPGIQKNVLRFSQVFFKPPEKKWIIGYSGVHESWVFNHYGHLRTLMVGSLELCSAMEHSGVKRSRMSPKRDGVTRLPPKK